jgi:Peptidase A4 family
MKSSGLTSGAGGRYVPKIIALTLLLLLTSPVDSPPPKVSPEATALRRHHLPIQIHRRRDQTTAESYNWSGYAVTGANGSVTDVKSSWVVPAVSCSGSPEGYAAFWTGIDGWTSSTVEQIGTDSDCVNLTGNATGTPTYYAWFEFYPQDAYLIGGYSGSGVCESDCVFPGDTISAEVSFSGSAGGGFRHRSGERFTVTITDETRGWSFTTTSTVPGARQSSAEWIAEAPSGCNTASGICELADFSMVDFGDYFTAVLNTASATVAGKTQPLGSFGSSVQEAVMVDYPSGATTMAQPSALEGGGTSFAVTWANAGP